MGLTKSEKFTPEENHMAGLLKALAHPARLKIVQFLLSTDSCICNDIVAEVNLAQSTVSQHLKELKKAGIIKGKIDGKAVCYCINPESFRQLEGFIDGVFHLLHTQSSYCSTDNSTQIK